MFSVILFSLVVILAGYLLLRKKTQKQNFTWTYERLKHLIKDEPLPCMIIDLDIIEQNLNSYSKYHKPLRLATKSIRVPTLIHKIAKRPEFAGRIMCFSAQEALFLSNCADYELDILIAYPIVSHSDLKHIFNIHKRHNVCLMVDCIEHVSLVHEYMQKHSIEGIVNLCIDIDMSLRVFGMHLGVYRSCIRSLDDFIKIVEYIHSGFSNVRLAGVMGYEAQVAGLGDNSPFDFLLVRYVKRLIRSRSIQHVYHFRKQISQWLKAKNIELEFFNGGGSGSIQSTAQEAWVTEITVGSGILQSALFDYYIDATSKCALFFALHVTRIPENDVVTCQSGGFIASGAVSLDKQPVPLLPYGVRYIENEGFGEVQTPLKHDNTQVLKLGDPIFFRPAKAGEIAERFETYIVVKDGEIIDKWKTYRGEHQTFY
jgi:D-serine deaminase-like pyridoxal phosphate-dependent protein